jgi:hypothetical protein
MRSFLPSNMFDDMDRALDLVTLIGPASSYHKLGIAAADVW